jgi:hypothetical protein
MGFILIVLGVIGVIGSLAADAIGIGTSPGIDWAQLLGAAIGLVVALVGIWLAFSKTVVKK